MKTLWKNGMVNLTMVERGLAKGLLSPTVDQIHLNPFVWILSSNVSPQPSGVFGVWDDGAIWSDTNIWYD